MYLDLFSALEVVLPLDFPTKTKWANQLKSVGNEKCARVSRWKNAARFHFLTFLWDNESSAGQTWKGNYGRRGFVPVQDKTGVAERRKCSQPGAWWLSAVSHLQNLPRSGWVWRGAEGGGNFWIFPLGWDRVLSERGGDENSLFCHRPQQAPRG